MRLIDDSPASRLLRRRIKPDGPLRRRVVPILAQPREHAVRLMAEREGLTHLLPLAVRYARELAAGLAAGATAGLA